MSRELPAKDDLTDTNHVELEPTLEQLPLNLSGDTIETDMAFGYHRIGDVGHDC